MVGSGPIHMATLMMPSLPTACGMPSPADGWQPRQQAQRRILEVHRLAAAVTCQTAPHILLLPNAGHIAKADLSFTSAGSQRALLVRLPQHAHRSGGVTRLKLCQSCWAAACPSLACPERQPACTAVACAAQLPAQELSCSCVSLQQLPTKPMMCWNVPQQGP